MDENKEEMKRNEWNKRNKKMMDENMENKYGTNGTKYGWKVGTCGK
jgi:hypothetical protein